MMNVTIRPESIEDLQSIWHVDQSAFEGDADLLVINHDLQRLVRFNSGSKGGFLNWRPELIWSSLV